jgi:arsenite methyltransferase
MHQNIKEYYGKTLQQSADLQTNACCTDTALPDVLKTALSHIHDEVLNRYYGCGLILPDLLTNKHILDLGCGAGRDCYVLSQLVGENGSVTGVDMTAEQLAVANQYLDWHTQRYGYQQANVRFLQGYIERLNELNLADAEFDLIVSNCVINLSPDKLAVLKQAYRLLKPGGELYFSDVYADRRIPQDLLQDPILLGECLSGALYWNDFHNLSKQAGFADPRLVEDRPLTIDNPAIQKRLGNIRFFSATYRLFKLDALEPACEDYGQAVIYQGTIEDHPDTFRLDKHHLMESHKVFPVCGNTWRMLHDSRFKPHFKFIGNWDRHYGIFEGCASALPYNDTPENTPESGSCC